MPLRIPGGDTGARRIEHRLARADANPYLLVLAILEAALDGIRQKHEAPRPVEDTCYDQGYPSVVANLRDAIRLMSGSTWMQSVLPPLFFEAYMSCKRQELAVFEAQVTELESSTYRNRI